MQLPHFLTAVATGLAIFLSQSTVLAQIAGPMSNLPTCAVSVPIASMRLLTHTDINYEPSLKRQKLPLQREIARSLTLPACARPQTCGNSTYRKSRPETVFHATRLRVRVRPSFNLIRLFKLHTTSRPYVRSEPY
jgi:hypothetical protein